MTWILTGRHGMTLPLALRPEHFEDFVASLALGRNTAISIIHHDGTVIARYPQNEKYVGRNVSGMRQFRFAMEHGGDISGRFTGSLGDRRRAA